MSARLIMPGGLQSPRCSGAVGFGCYRRHLGGEQSGHGDVSAGLGITGFCWGGRIVWLYAAHNPTPESGAWPGTGIWSVSLIVLHPTNPIDGVGCPDLRAPVLGLYGGRRPAVSPRTPSHSMRAALKAKDGISGDLTDHRVPRCRSRLSCRLSDLGIMPKTPPTATRRCWNGSTPTASHARAEGPGSIQRRMGTDGSSHTQMPNGRAV